MDNNDVVKKALAVAAAKAGHKDVKDFLKTKGVEVSTPPEKVEKVEPKREKYCDRSCQGTLYQVPAPAPEKEEVQRATPIWPLPEGETLEQFKARREAEKAADAKKREDFLKSLDTPEHLAAIRASAIEAASKLPSRHIPIPTSKQEVKAEKREAKAKAKAEKKDSGRQNRLGQTKLIDDLIKVGKTEKEIFDAVREKIPAYPADKLPKLIKLRQYHVKK